MGDCRAVGFAAPLALLQNTNHLLVQIFCALPYPDSELSQKTQSSFHSSYPLEVSFQNSLVIRNTLLSMFLIFPLEQVVLAP